MVVYRYKNKVDHIGMATIVEFNKLKVIPTEYKMVDMSLCYANDIIKMFKEWNMNDVSEELFDILQDDDICTINNN